MMTERNALCLCGSGKKYKKCHGAPSAFDIDKEDAISWQRRAAYEGSQGQQREDFIKRYTVYKKHRLSEITDSTNLTARAGGKTISCGEGCAHCCHIYVSATLPECEAIVYNLYQHEGAFRNFLNNYANWQQHIRSIDAAYKEIGRLRSRQLAQLVNEAECTALSAALNTYASLYIPCPFLSQASCSIYEVRPYVCAGLVATTPREWCRYGHSAQEHAEFIKAKAYLDNDMPYLDNSLVKIMVSNLPALVNALLYRGWDLLGRVSGFEVPAQSNSDSLS